jgi:hypothetical protein
MANPASFPKSKSPHSELSAKNAKEDDREHKPNRGAVSREPKSSVKAAAKAKPEQAAAKAVTPLYCVTALQKPKGTH